MAENSENFTEIKDPNLNKYMTRKKVIDFAKIGEKLSLTGSNCHYCRSIMTVQDSNACRNTDKLNLKKKTCNKKFCYDCLQKNFSKFWENRSNKDWKCPCCLDECSCTQCKKLWKLKTKNYPKLTNDEELVNENDDNMSFLSQEQENMTKNHNSDNFSHFGNLNTNLNNNNNYNNNFFNNMTTLNKSRSRESLNQSNGNNHNYSEKRFDIQNIYNILGMNQNALEKYSTYINKNKMATSSEKMFSSYEQAKAKHLETLDKYKDKISSVNVFKKS